MWNFVYSGRTTHLQVSGPGFLVELSDRLDLKMILVLTLDFAF